MRKSFVKGTALTLSSVMALSLMPSVSAFAYQDGDSIYEWKTEEGKEYWYENGQRQGVYGSKGNVFYDNTERGREIYDRESDGWYWLDAVYDGAKAVDKEVFMPYIYSNEEENLSNTDWIGETSSLSNKTAEFVAANGGEVVDLSAQVKKAMESHGAEGAGKWVRYDANGKMVKGWYKVQGSDETLYPEQAGNVYYYDRQTGLMAKGNVTIDGVAYTFDEVSGKLTSGNAPDVFGNSTNTDNTNTENNNTENNNTDSSEDSSSSTEKTITLNGITRLDNGKYHVFSGAKELSSDVKEGDVVKFGSCEQDNNLDNGKEAIEWEVLAVEKGEALLISRYVLGFHSYADSESFSAPAWKNSELRKYLNNDFYSSVFGSEEQEVIANITTITDSGRRNSYLPEYMQWDTTVDKVYCFTFADILKYYGFNTWYTEQNQGPMGEWNCGYSEQLITDATPYALTTLKSNSSYNQPFYLEMTQAHYEAYKDYGYTENVIGKKGANWWLRDAKMGLDDDYEVYVLPNGYFSRGYVEMYSATEDQIGYRPVIKVKI